MTTMRVEPVLEVLAALGEIPSPVRYPALYATVDRLFRTGPQDASLGHVVRWLLQSDHATVRVDGLHLRPQVAAVAQRARAALDNGDPATRATLLQELEIDGAVIPEAFNDVAARMLLVPPVPATWPQDPTRGWALTDAAVIAAASRTGRITSARVRQVWFETQSTELDQTELANAVLVLTAARLTTVGSATLRLTRDGRRCRKFARRRLSWADGRWSGDQPLWAALAALAEYAAAVDSADHAPRGLAAWLDHGIPSSARRSRH